MIKAASGAAALLVLVIGLQGRAQEQRRGGPPPVYRTEVPESLLNVVAGAPTGSSIVLSILGQEGEPAILEVTDPAGEAVDRKEVRLPSGKPSSVELTGLKEGLSYRYILTQGSQRIEGRFTTLRPSGEDFTFAVQADSHLDGNSATGVYERTLANIAADKPDFLVDLGDTFMVDKYARHEDSLAQYKAQRYWFSRVGSEMSVYLCLGNHDGESGWPTRGGADVAGWSRSQRELWFPPIRPNATYSGAPMKGLYYAWTTGGVDFIVLDPFVATIRKTRTESDGWNWTLGREQYDWLQGFLEKSASRLKFVFIHHLVGGNGKEARGGVEAADRFEWGGSEEFASQRPGWSMPIHSLLKKHGVSAVLRGHDHLYARQEKDGIVYLCLPQPSHARGNSAGSAADYGYKTGVILGSSGHIRASVKGGEATLEYVKSLPGDQNRSVVDSVKIKPQK